MLLHDGGGEYDGNTESGDDADENEGHFPLLNESDNERDEEHCDAVDCQGDFL